VQNKTKEYNTALFNHWLAKNEEFFFYIDGHVLIYYGYASLPKVKAVARVPPLGVLFPLPSTSYPAHLTPLIFNLSSFVVELFILTCLLSLS